jgi:acyl-CoA hydrolase/GNAT superfamily N-acetyltransferase
LIGSGAAEPNRLVDALVSCGAHLADNEVIHLLTLGPAPYVAPEMAGRLRHCAFFIGANVREAVQQGRADFIPVFLSEIPELIRSRRVGIDVALIQTSPPDAHGFVSLGVSVDVVRAAVDTAQLVLAEVNPRMPRTHGDSFLHVSKIASLVHVDEPLPELLPEPPGPIEEAIGHHVARLIADGATLQLGIGSIPDAILGALRHHRDLGVHTEMLSDGVMRLFEEGVITGARKSHLRGKMVASFVMGSRELYEWAHENPALEMRASDYTNDPFVIARNDQMVSVNSALAVDLTGQVAADTLGGRLFSGIGGQVDFVRGSARSRGGKSIIALRSTAKEGTISRIVPALEEGAGVVTSRGDVRYVATEYGVADLWGKSIRERALSLIEIAHPTFRAELLSEAKRRRYVFVDQPVPAALYPWKEETRERLLDGSWVTFRPVRMSDQEPLQRMLYALSDESTYKRFLAHKRVHPRDEMQQLVDTDYERSMGLVAELDGGELVGFARYDVEPDVRFAEIAFVVSDAWQAKGIGTLLLKRMSAIGKTRGLVGFRATALTSNKPMLLIFQRSGLHVQSHFDGAVVRLLALFDAPSMKSGLATP